MDRTPTAEHLSALDAAFLLLERPEQPLLMGCVAELEGPVDPGRLLERLEDLVRRYPRLRQRPVRVPLDLDRPAWEDDPSFALIRHLRTTDLPAPGDRRALQDVVELVLSSRLKPERPPWEIVSIAGAANRGSAVVLRAHHCMLDGQSGMRLLDLLCDPIACEPGTVRAARGQRQGDDDRARRSRWSPLDDHPAETPVWDHMRGMAELTATFVSLVHDDPAPATPLNTPLSARRRATWTTFRRDEYGPLCRETGTTVNDVMLAVIAGALRRYLWRHHRAAVRRPWRALVPVSLRTAGETRSLGNAISAMFPRLPIEVADPLERLDRVASEIRALRARGQPAATAYGLRMIESLPAAVGAALPALVPATPIVNTVCTNVAGPRGARSLAGSPIRALHGIVPLFHRVGVEFAVVTHDRELSVCAHLDPTVVSHGDELAADLAQAFAQLRQAEKRTRRHRREIERIGALLRPVSRFGSVRSAREKAASARRSDQSDVP